MWAAAARDVSSRSPPPAGASERHLSITDSIVSTTAEEIRERYRLSSFQDEPTRQPQPRPMPHFRRDSMFSFNTTWTADESFMDSAGMISDFPRPPGMGMMPPRFAPPALPSSLGHLPPTAEAREPPPDSARYTEQTNSATITPYADSFGYTNSPGLAVQPSAYSSSTFLPANSPQTDRIPSPPLPPPPPRSNGRPGTAPSALTVRTDAARYLDPNAGEIEIVTGPSPTSLRFPSPNGSAGRGSVAGSNARTSMATSNARTSVAGSNGRTSVAGSNGRTSLASHTRLSPSGTRQSPTSPSSQYLVPSPSSLTYTRASPTDTNTHTQTYTTIRTSPTGTDKTHAYPPVSPATAAFLSKPVRPPSTHASHEGLLDPGFIRTLMRGIEHNNDGLSIDMSTGEGDSREGPFGDRHASSSQLPPSPSELPPSLPPSPRPPPPNSPLHPYDYSVEASEPEAQPASPPTDSKGGVYFRRAPAASLPSSPRSSFSFSVRSGIGKNVWEDNVPDVPPIPAAYRQQPDSPRDSEPNTPPVPISPPSHEPPSPPGHAPTSTHSHVPSTPVSTSAGSLRPDWASRRRSVESRKTTVTGRSGGSGLTGITEQSSALESEETGVVTHAALVRTASLAERRPAVYRSSEILRSPPAGISEWGTNNTTGHAGGSEWHTTAGGSHARTTSADLGHLNEAAAVRNRRSVQQLQFISVTHPRARGVPVEEEEEEGDDLVYATREGEEVRVSQYDLIEGYTRESRYDPRESAYGARESRYDPRESRYDPRGSRYTSRYPDSYLDSPYVGSWADPPSPNEITPALRDSMINDTASYMRPGAMHTPISPASGRMIPPFARDYSHSPSTAPATPGHGPSTPGLFPGPPTPGLGACIPPNSAPLPDEPTTAASKRAKRASATSFVSSVFSKFSGHASAGHNSGAKGFSFAWRNQENVPPLPVPSPLVARMLEVEGGKGSVHSGAGTGNGTESTRVSAVVRREGTMELPALANRAERLGEMLELGKLPHRSKSTITASPRMVDVPVGVDQEGNDITGEGYTDEKALRRNRSIRSVFTTFSDRSRRFMGGGLPNNGSASLRSSIVDVPGQQNLRFNKLPEEHRKVQWGEGTGVKPPRPLRNRPSLMRKRLLMLLAIAAIAIVAIIGVSVGLTRGRRVPDAGGFTCSVTNQTGRLCDLNAACTCTSSLAGQCNPLAQSIVDLIEPINQFFDPSPAFTPASVALSLWELQGSPLVGANCANQAELIDVGPALSSEGGSTAANRTEFARSALLWTLVMSMDVNSTARMQDFIQDLDFTRLDGPNGASVAGEYLFGAAGYQVDFGKMTVSQPAVSWVNSGKPSDDQVARVGSDLSKALDRVYTFAAASSAQRSSALARYWTNVLQFPASQLATFRTIASASPVLLPFDASSSGIRSLFNNVNQSFPPPAACYSGLSADELAAINTMETQAFGLSKVTSAPSSLDPSCFASRPVYGVLDIARLRTSFTSVEQPAPKQAVQISTDSTSRVSVRLGRDLAGLPTTSISTANRTGSDDARTFGTLNNMDHVLLTYLQAFPSIQAAGALVEYVLGASDARAPPPSNTSALFNLTSSLAQLPVLEVAFFGTIGSDDLSLAMADFATKDGELFFGSSAGDAFRDWATQRAGSVMWSDGPIAAQVVRESVEDPTFEAVWKSAGTLLSNAETVGTKTSRADVQEVVDAFTRIGYMGS